MLAAFALGAVLLIQSGTVPSARESAVSALAALVAEAGPIRLSEGRLSGGFAYARYTLPRPRPPERLSLQPAPGTRGGAEEDLASTRARIQALAARTSPRDLHALGVALLFDQDKVDQAVTALEQADRLAPGNARLLSDLSAARLARAARWQDPVDLLGALSAAESAVAADDQRPEALFNFALALEKLRLPEAPEAWRRYLRLDPDSPWGDEAELRLSRLLPPADRGSWTDAGRELEAATARGDLRRAGELVRRFKEPSRDHAERDLLGEWAGLQARGEREGAVRVLRQLETLGQVLAEVTGDRLIADAAAAIESASTRPERLAAMVRGYQAWRSGLELEAKRRYQDAVERFAEAAEELRRAGSPFAVLVDFRRARSLYLQQDLELALAVVDPIAGNEALRRYPSLLGRASWLAGLIRGVQGDSTGCLGRYQEAAARFEATGETASAGDVHIRMAEQLRLLGDRAEAWRHLHAALGAVIAGRDPRHLQTALTEAAEIAAGLGQPRAALRYHGWAVRTAMQTDDPELSTYALLRRCLLRQRSGDPGGAAADLGQAQDLAARIPESATSLRVRGDLLAVEAERVRDSDPRRAVEALTEALQLLEQRQPGAVLARLFRTRSQAWLALGDELQAEADLRAGIRAVERQRGAVDDERLRISYQDDSEEVFRDMVRLQARRGRAALAFDFAERGRARTLLDRLAAAAAPGGEKTQARPLPTVSVLRDLPEGVALAEMAVLDDEIVVWVLARGGLTSLRVPVRSVELEAEVETFSAAVAKAGSREDLARASRGLYRLLLRDLLSKVPEDALLVLVPDGPLHVLPWAALTDPDTGRTLIEEHALAYAPSATLYLKALERDRALAGEEHGILLVGDPAFPSSEHPLLERLPYAEAEVRRIGRLYSGPRRLAPEEATEDAFLSAAGRFSVVHFAGHTVINPDSPALSYMVLAGEGEESILYAEEVHGVRFEHTRLLVLGACDTARGRRSPSEGVISLARSFFAAGVPVVVAASWRIEDRAASSLLFAFHRHLRAGAPAPAALRAAQLELLASPDPELHAPASWAGVQVIGGGLPARPNH